MTEENVKTNQQTVDERGSSYDEYYDDDYDDYIPINNEGIKSCLGCMITLIIIAALLITIVVCIFNYIYNLCS
jgi:hypothetical protein